MEPIFLAAEVDAIPELRRFVVSDGVRVVMTEDLAAGIAALAGRGGAAALAPSSGEQRWPDAALELLNRAEERLRRGDWTGFGEALRELRALLERTGSSGPSPGR
jgi:uncharacterized membrane protein (UPF0182 family)